MIWLIEALERESRSDLPSCCPLMIHITIGYCLEYLAYKHNRTATSKLESLCAGQFSFSIQFTKGQNAFASLCQVIEMKKIQSNVQIGNILLRSRNYIKARPQVFCTEMGQVHPMFLYFIILASH